MSKRTLIPLVLLIALALGVGLPWSVAAYRQHQDAQLAQSMSLVESDMNQLATQQGVDPKTLAIAQDALANARRSMATGDRDNERNYLQVAAINLLIISHGGSLPVDEIESGLKKYGL